VEPKNCGGVGIVSFFILFCFFVGKMERGGGCLFGKGGYNGIRANIWWKTADPDDDVCVCEWAEHDYG